MDAVDVGGDVGRTEGHHRSLRQQGRGPMEAEWAPTALGQPSVRQPPEGRLLDMLATSPTAPAAASPGTGASAGRRPLSDTLGQWTKPDAFASVQPQHPSQRTKQLHYSDYQQHKQLQERQPAAEDLGGSSLPRAPRATSVPERGDAKAEQEGLAAPVQPRGTAQTVGHALPPSLARGLGDAAAGRDVESHARLALRIVNVQPTMLQSVVSLVKAAGLLGGIAPVVLIQPANGPHTLLPEPPPPGTVRVLYQLPDGRIMAQEEPSPPMEGAGSGRAGQQRPTAEEPAVEYDKALRELVWAHCAEGGLSDVQFLAVTDEVQQGHQRGSGASATAAPPPPGARETPADTPLRRVGSGRGEMAAPDRRGVSRLSQQQYNSAQEQSQQLEKPTQGQEQGGSREGPAVVAPDQQQPPTGQLAPARGEARHDAVLQHLARQLSGLAGGLGVPSNFLSGPDHSPIKASAGQLPSGAPASLESPLKTSEEVIPQGSALQPLPMHPKPQARPPQEHPGDRPAAAAAGRQDPGLRGEGTAARTTRKHGRDDCEGGEGREDAGSGPAARRERAPLMTAGPSWQGPQEGCWRDLAAEGGEGGGRQAKRPAAGQISPVVAAAGGDVGGAAGRASLASNERRDLRGDPALSQLLPLVSLGGGGGGGGCGGGRPARVAKGQQSVSGQQQMPAAQPLRPPGWPAALLPLPAHLLPCGMLVARSGDARLGDIAGNESDTTGEEGPSDMYGVGSRTSHRSAQQQQQINQQQQQAQRPLPSAAGSGQGAFQSVRADSPLAGRVQEEGSARVLAAGARSVDPIPVTEPAAQGALSWSRLVPFLSAIQSSQRASRLRHRCEDAGDDEAGDDEAAGGILRPLRMPGGPEAGGGELSQGPRLVPQRPPQAVQEAVVQLGGAGPGGEGIGSGGTADPGGFGDLGQGLQSLQLSAQQRLLKVPAGFLAANEQQQQQLLALTAQSLYRQLGQQTAFREALGEGASAQRGGSKP